MPVWGAAGRLFGISWTVLAGITQAETSLGCDLSVSSAGAQGWTQFMPSTWATWGTDADADGTADPYDDVDAIFSTARYLAASGAPGNYRAAIFAYNHSEAYVNEVLGYAAEFEAGQPNAASATADLGRLTAAERRLRARAASDTARAQKIRADVKNTETAVAASSEALERVEQRLSRLQEELARLQAVRRFEAARFETTGLASREAALAVASGSRQNPSLVYLEVSAMQTAQTRAAASLEHREQHARTLEGPLLSQVQALNAHAAADRQALAQAQQLQENAEQAEQKASGLSVVAHAGAHPHR